MKNFKFTKLALAVAFTGGALVGCDTDYDTKAVNTEDATQTSSKGEFVVAELNRTNEATAQSVQYGDDSQDSMASDQDEYGAQDQYGADQQDETAQSDQDQMPGPVEERRPGADDTYGTDSGVRDYAYRSDANQTIQFDFDSSELSDDAKEKLDQFVQSMSQDNLASVEVNIKGYTDETGPEEYNQDLAKRRAEAVRDYLEEQGLASYNLKINAIGEPQGDEVADNAQANRRVDLSIEQPYSEGEETS